RIVRIEFPVCLPRQRLVLSGGPERDAIERRRHLLLDDDLLHRRSSRCRREQESGHDENENTRRGTLHVGLLSYPELLHIFPDNRRQVLLGLLRNELGPRNNSRRQGVLTGAGS